MEAHRSEQVAVAAHGTPGRTARRPTLPGPGPLPDLRGAGGGHRPGGGAVTYFPAIPQAPTLISLAILKFFLIASIYMHLRYDSRVFSAFFMIGLILATGMLVSFLASSRAHPRLPVSATAPTPAPTTGAPWPRRPALARSHQGERQRDCPWRRARSGCAGPSSRTSCWG